MGLSFSAKAIFSPNRIDFAKIKYKNVQYFNLVYVREPKFGVLDLFAIARPELFLALFLSFFSTFLLQLPFAFHILTGC